MATNAIGGVLLPKDYSSRQQPPIRSTALDTVVSLFRGVSNAFVGFVADLHAEPSSKALAARDRHLYLAVLVIVILLVVNLISG